MIINQTKFKPTKFEPTEQQILDYIYSPKREKIESIELLQISLARFEDEFFDDAPKKELYEAFQAIRQAIKTIDKEFN